MLRYCASGQRSRALYADFAAYMDRFYVGGWRKLLVEFACEGLTLGLAGGVLMLGLAVPAFQETSDEDWLKKQDLAVTFLDRYGQEVGRRGIKHDDSTPLSEFPDQLIKAVLATEDRRFYEHWGIDPIGTFRALTVNARSSGVVQGDGEVCINALEICLTGTFTFVLHKKTGVAPLLSYPRAETATHFITMGMNEDLDLAMKQALRQMIDFICARSNLSRQQAYQFCSLAVDFHVTQTVNGEKGVHGMLRKGLIF